MGVCVLYTYLLCECVFPHGVDCDFEGWHALEVVIGKELLAYAMHHQH